jgi:hypothetical protein
VVLFGSGMLRLEARSCKDGCVKYPFEACEEVDEARDRSGRKAEDGGSGEGSRWSGFIP